MKYFTIAELTASDTAKAKGIDNTPDAQIELKIIELIDTMLDPFRKAWGSAIRVNSGYRCSELNKAVGGAGTSAHKVGYAADLYPVNGKFEDFVAFAKVYFADKPFDEVLIESNSSGAQWLHVALYSIGGQQRRKLLTINV